MSTSNIERTSDGTPKHVLSIDNDGIFGPDELQITGPHKDGEFIFLMQHGLEIQAMTMTKKELFELASMCRRAIK